MTLPVIKLENEPFICEYYFDVSMAFKHVFKLEFDRQKFDDITLAYVAQQFYKQWKFVQSPKGVFSMGKKPGQFLFQTQHPAIASEIKKQGGFNMELPQTSLG